MKFVILQPYFGKFPEWMDLFLFSCGKNKNVDFVFFTDCKPTSIQRSYSNIKFIDISFKDYCKQVSDRLDIDFKPESTYKLCDLKPFLGIVHYDIISTYDCWGYCDIDLVFGDLTMLLDKMGEFDFISTHTDRSSGHFTLMKTQSKFTKACFKIKNWRNKLMMQKNKCLDENDLTIVVEKFMFYRDRFYDRFIKRNKFALLKNVFCRATNLIHSLVRNKKVSFEEYFTTPKPDFESKYIYDLQSSKIFDAINKRELPYLHFLFFKKTKYSDNTDYWKKGFYHFKQGETFLSYRNIEINKKGIFGIV